MAAAGPEIPIPLAPPLGVPVPPCLGARSVTGVPAVLADDATGGRTCSRAFEIPLRASGDESSTGRPETEKSDSGSASACAPFEKPADAWCADATAIMVGN
jgi:hypothetical protein